MAPRVSIALPVYNGEKYLHHAVESILGQSYGDFELQIFDNASTDGTEAIARGYAAADRRVSYHRRPFNLGSARNFNHAVHRATGEYFKWAAADDLLAPRFLERCVGALDNDPSAVLAFPRTAVIDEEGGYLRHYDFPLHGHAAKAHHRFRRQIIGHQCYEVFGLMRSQVLRATRLIGNFAGGDAALLLDLCLRGRFTEIPEVLFFSRAHPEQSSALRRDARRFARWFDPDWSGQVIFPYWRLLGEYLRIVHSAPVGRLTRTVCSLHVAEWARRRTPLLIRDLLTGTVDLWDYFRARPPRSCGDA